MLALLACGVAAFAAAEARAQPAGLNPGRDCQVVRACNYGRGGAYRGCLSSYTCRVCRFVPSRCYVNGAPGVCQRMRCTWGG
jgi:hypothetical protein